MDFETFRTSIYVIIEQILVSDDNCFLAQLRQFGQVLREFQGFPCQSPYKSHVFGLLLPRFSTLRVHRSNSVDKRSSNEKSTVIRFLQIDIFTPSKQRKVQSQRTHQNKKRKKKKIQRIHAELFILVLAANVVADLQAYYAVSLVKKLNATHCKTHRLTRQFRRINSSA